jgi:hypothetical protein
VGEIALILPHRLPHLGNHRDPAREVAGLDAAQGIPVVQVRSIQRPRRRDRPRLEIRLPYRVLNLEPDRPVKEACVEVRQAVVRRKPRRERALPEAAGPSTAMIMGASSLSRRPG